LTEVRTYREALEHVEFTCGGGKADYKAIIRDFALAKGLPQRSGEKQIEAFFVVQSSANRLTRAIPLHA
jgi:hypothetical protein